MENVLNINKILLAQINTISCNVEFNKNRAIEVIKQGIENNCEMVVFPKNFLVSNDIGNVLERFNFISNQVKIAVEELVQYSSKIAILIGAINDEFYFLNEQEKIKIDNNSNKIFDFKNVKFQILSSYEEKKENVDIVLDLNPYYSRYLADSEKHTEILKYIEKNHVKYLFLNQIGAYDEFVYAGLSRYYDEFFNLKACAKSFEEENFIVEFQKEQELDLFSK